MGSGRWLRLGLALSAAILTACGPSPRSSTRAETSTTFAPTTTALAVNKRSEPMSNVLVIDDSHLVVTYMAPSCNRSAGHTVTFAPDTVTVTIFSANVIGPACAGGVAQGTEDIALQEPLRGRRIIDGACASGQPVGGSSTCAAGFTTTHP